VQDFVKAWHAWSGLRNLSEGGSEDAKRVRSHGLLDGVVNVGEHSPPVDASKVKSVLDVRELLTAARDMLAIGGISASSQEELAADSIAIGRAQSAFVGRTHDVRAGNGDLDSACWSNSLHEGSDAFFDSRTNSCIRAELAIETNLVRNLAHSIRDVFAALGEEAGHELGLPLLMFASGLVLRPVGSVVEKPDLMLSRLSLLAKRVLGA
jgi:hypothetical protein